MKNIASTLALLAATMIGAASYADPALKSQYSSTLHPATATVGANLLHPPTDITVTNVSNNPFYVIVPNSPVNDYLRPGLSDHIHNYDPNVYSTFVVLQDTYQRTFYSATVCREAILTVTGYTGNFTVTLDNDLCY